MLYVMGPHAISPPPPRRPSLSPYHPVATGVHAPIDVVLAVGTIVAGTGFEGPNCATKFHQDDANDGGIGGFVESVQTDSNHENAGSPSTEATEADAEAAADAKQKQSFAASVGAGTAGGIVLVLAFLAGVYWSKTHKETGAYGHGNVMVNSLYDAGSSNADQMYLPAN